MKPDGAFMANCRNLDVAAIVSDDEKREQATGVREINCVEGRSGLKENRPLREGDLFQIPIERRESFGGQRRKQAVVPVAVFGAIDQLSLLTLPKGTTQSGRSSRLGESVGLPPLLLRDRSRHEGNGVIAKPDHVALAALGEVDDVQGEGFASGDRVARGRQRAIGDQ
jgi:hypothetical protein